VLISALCVAPLLAQTETKKRLEAAAEVFKEIMDTRDKSIPQDLLDKSQCTVIVPGVKKAGFILAGKYGRGFAACRNKDGKGWGAPSGVKVEGGSFGLQIGASETDFVMLIMNRRGMDRLTESKFTLGADASVAAGPVGRETTAQTDATMRAEILSWSRSRGIFGGLALDGATLRPDHDANTDVYGKKIEPKEILLGGTPVPALAEPLVSLLTKYSGRASK
jgi:lipid-binding SYLF domain-containing protein